MEEKCQPLVSVSVITYNSSKTVIETLDSIYNQTYPNIELIVSDDCSADKTVELCCDWIDSHKDRFSRVELLTVEKNTGISGNCNRAENACRGEWIKSIAGDDLLVDDCIESCVDYVNEHEDVVVLFGRQDAFCADKKRCEEVNAIFDYEMLMRSSEEQLHKLIFDRNYIPATTLFYHKERYAHIGVKNDERIPLLEDWPKWINLLRAGVKFHFIDKVLVKYRVGGISTFVSVLSEKMYATERLMLYYYQYPEWYKENPDNAIQRMVEKDMLIYRMYLNERKRINSHAYRLGKIILRPIKYIRNILHL